LDTSCVLGRPRARLTVTVTCDMVRELETAAVGNIQPRSVVAIVVKLKAGKEQ
jgi:hypothetical protein